MLNKFWAGILQIFASCLRTEPEREMKSCYLIFALNNCPRNFSFSCRYGALNMQLLVLHRFHNRLYNHGEGPY